MGAELGVTRNKMNLNSCLGAIALSSIVLLNPEQSARAEVSDRTGMSMSMSAATAQTRFFGMTGEPERSLTCSQRAVR